MKWHRKCLEVCVYMGACTCTCCSTEFDQMEAKLNFGRNLRHIFMYLSPQAHGFPLHRLHNSSAQCKHNTMHNNDDI